MVETFHSKTKRPDAGQNESVSNSTRGNGNILVDTGVGTAYFSPPKGPNFGQLIACKRGSKIECMSNGNAINIYLPDDKSPVASYSFIVG